MDGPVLYVFVIAADGSILQTGHVTSMEAAGVIPTPAGGSVQVFSDPPVATQGSDRWNATTKAFEPVAVVPPPGPSLAELKAEKAALVRDAFAARLVAGLPYGGLHVQIDDGSRANLLALVATASLVGQGTIQWPSDYARGWVSIEGGRVPLAAPQDGVNLALTASAYYAALVQHEQDLIDACDGAADASSLGAVDVTAGWP